MREALILLMGFVFLVLSIPVVAYVLSSFNDLKHSSPVGLLILISVGLIAYVAIDNR